jgi:hypothetical protein
VGGETPISFAVGAANLWQPRGRRAQNRAICADLPVGLGVSEHYSNI